MLYDLLIAYIIAFNLIDIYATLWFINNESAIEINPLMVQALEYGVSFFIFCKLTLVLGGCYNLQRNKHRKTAKYSIWGAFMVYFILMLYFLFNTLIMA